MCNRSVFCVLHKLESFHVQLLDLDGGEATDELVQCDHLCSSQLLRRQVVVFSNPLPHWRHLLRIGVFVIRENREQDQYNSHEHVILFSALHL